MNALESKRAVVTGAGGGIGRATAIALAEAGAHVAVFDVRRDAAEETCSLIEGKGGRALPLVGSVADSASVKRCFVEHDERCGGVDILVNNAGVSGNRPALDLSDEEWHRTVSINLDGVFFCCREAGRRMRDAGGGSIVNIGSIYALVAAPNRLQYCATKAAVEMLTRTLAIEWASFGIRVNGIAPGYVATPLLQELALAGKVNLEAIKRRTPQGRLGLVEEIADAILYLCEPRSGYVTGQMLAVDGGWSAYGYI